MKILAPGLALALLTIGLTPRSHSKVDQATHSSVDQATHSGLGQTPAGKPRIEVVFAIDTTGSMSGLIDGAKAKIWSIARALSQGQPRPEIAIGLVAYRDLGDEYVTRTSPLTSDLDLVYRDLMALRAEGGGDGPEHVNRALAVATGEIAWSENKGVTRILFLVGDAPAHMDYPQDIPWTATIERAVRKGIIVHTVRCGEDADVAAQFADMARRGEGKFVSLEQDGGMQVVSTPLDARLSELRREIAGTYVPYGERKDRDARLARARKAEEVAATAPAPAAADRAAFLSGSGEGLGEADLVAAVASGSVALEKLDADDLPEELKDSKPEERAAKLASIRQQRQVLEAEMAKVSAKRDELLAKAEATAGRDSFNEKVLGAVREQAAKNGVRY